MKPELKPCPFCGGDASFDYDDNGWNWIHCKSCDATTDARVSAMDDCRPLLAEAWNRRAPAEPVNEHPDDAAVDGFAAAMKAKLAKKRAEGRGGWQACDAAYLSELLRGHVEKGDPVDVANLAMMLHQNGQHITLVEPVKVSSVREFEEWLNDNRRHDVSSVFHEIVARYAKAPQPQQIPEGYKPVHSLAEVWEINAAEFKEYGDDSRAEAYNECAKELRAMLEAEPESKENQ